MMRQALRVLHTLKGSARLAGALRLGEMAHRMESVIQAQGEAVAPAEMLDALVARFDTMQASLAALRAPAPELVDKMEEGSVEASSSVPPPPAENQNAAAQWVTVQIVQQGRLSALLQKTS